GTATPTIYLEDAEAGIAIYAKNTSLAVGDKLNGIVGGKGYVYNGLTELTSITGFEKTTGAEVPCTEVTLALLAEDGMDAWESRRVIVKDLTITSAMNNRNATVEQNGISFTIREGASGCTGEKLSSAENGIASVVGYFQDYNSTTQLNVWSEDDIDLTEKVDAQVVFDVEEGAGTNESPLAYTIGEDNTFPTAVVKDSEGNVIDGATVTYSTTNGSYISVDAETGVVTLKKYASKSNNVHVTATFAGNAEYKSATADYYLTIAKGTPVINFSESTVSVALDGTAGQAATVDTEKYGNLAVTYTSSNPDVASFADANNATLTLNAEGTTTISAKTVSNDAWNQSDKVTYTLTVTAPTAGYAFVTLNACGNDVEGGATELKVVKGRTVTLPVATTIKDEYTFYGWTSTGEVAKTSTAPALVDNNYVVNSDVTLYPVFSFGESDGEPRTDIGWVLKGLNELNLSESVVIVSTSGSVSKILSGDQSTASYFTGRDATIENGVITSDVSSTYEWTMGEYDGNYDFTSNNNSGYLFNMGCSYSSYERWALSANGENTYSMESLGGSPYNNSGSYVYLDNNTWRMTADASQSKIQFFQIDEYPVQGATTTYYVSWITVAIPLNAACNDGEYVYATFCSSKPFYVPEDVVVAEVGIVDNKLFVEEYTTGDIVPANTGVMISATDGGTYYAEVADTEMAELAESVLGDDNCLRPSGDGGITAGTMGSKDSNCEYFRLTMHKGTQIGFWWGAENGAAFDVVANKAYLVIPKEQAAKMNGFWIDGETNGISSVNDDIDGNETYYNIAGQRVNASHKGIVIVNGRKYINK
ncbi:MAG: hypothetical protein Q4D33_06660, partial [Prevotellaceae bacterium]|nr:hypothetical protein [Prevotellaceae bacterium]